MLSPLDDYPVHQIAEPMRFVGTSDRNFYDRYYFQGHPRAGGLVLVAGLGTYPNRDVCDAFLAVVRDGTQRVVRASRQLGTDRADTASAARASSSSPCSGPSPTASRRAATWR